MNDLKLAFVFTNYNNFLHTIKVVRSIIDFSINSPIVIVDNNSNEENITELSKIESQFSNVNIIYNQDNIGYFKGLNVGIDFVRKKFLFDVLVIGNNDLIFPVTFLDDIYQKRDIFDKYSVVSPNIITLDNECQNPHVINKISRFRHFIYDLYFFNYSLSKIILLLNFKLKNISKRKDYLYSNLPMVIYQGYGACYLLGPLFFKYYNQLFAPTFLMGEEFFLAYQLKLQNLELYYEPTIRVYHQDHASTGLIESKKFWKISKESHKIYKKYFKSYE